MVTSLDVRQANLSRIFAQDELNAGEAAYTESVINYNIVLGRPGKKDLFIPEGKLEKVPDLNKIIAKLKASLENEDLIDIDSIKNQNRIAKLNFEIIKGEKYPELSLIASGKSIGEQIDKGDNYWNIGLVMQMNLYDGDRIKSKKVIAKTQLDTNKSQLRKLVKFLSGEIHKLSVNAESLAKRILLGLEAVKLSKENYEDARGQYRAGTITLTRLGEFSLAYAESRFNILRLFFHQRNLLTNSYALLNETNGSDTGSN
ncbi:hypothetical protein GMMP15_1790002 [Candidatus Magnetomoraceae bacterium gMMP-15]